MPTKQAVITSLFAGILLFTGDVGHIQSGTAFYAGEQGPRLLGVPVWVFFEFTLAVLALALTHSRRSSIFHWRTHPFTRGILALSSAFTLMIYLSTSLPESSLAFKWTVLAGLFSAQIFLLRKIVIECLWDALAIAAGGTVFEMLLGHLEIFQYTPGPHMLANVRAWLPLIYMSAALSARVLGDFLQKR